MLDITEPYENVLMIYGKGIDTQRYTCGLDVLSLNTWNKSICNWNQNCVKAITSKKADRGYYLQDELGSPVRIVGEAGNTKAIYSYDAFGRPIIPVKLISQCKTRGNIYSYTGYQYDLSTGLMYAQARYYMPEVGRFISEDAYKGTVAKPQSLNWYVYCANNPLVYYDPTGHWKTITENNSVYYVAEKGDTLSGLAYKVYKDANRWKDLGFTRAPESLRIGEKIKDNNLYSAHFKESGEACNSSKGSTSQGIGSSNLLQASSLPGKGEPNSTGRLYNPDGTLKQERWYGPDGRAVRDRDYNHSGEETHKFPHDHEWDWNKTPPRQKGVPVPPAPAPKTAPTPDPNKIHDSTSWVENAAPAAEWAAAGALIYWIISEGSRVLFPPRNLIPVP